MNVGYLRWSSSSELRELEKRREEEGEGGGEDGGERREREKREEGEEEGEIVNFLLKFDVLLLALAEEGKEELFSFGISNVFSFLFCLKGLSNG